jgi:hypothetical protein
MTSPPLVVIVLAVAALSAANAQQRDTSAAHRAGAPRLAPLDTQSRRDIVLEVPGLAVDSLSLDVVALRAHLSLDANAMRLVQIEAGLDLSTTKTRLGMGDVFTEAYFYTSLGNVTRIVDRIIQSLNRNPALLTGVAPSPTTPPPPTGADSSRPLVRPRP